MRKTFLYWMSQTFFFFNFPSTFPFSVLLLACGYINFRFPKSFHQFLWGFVRAPIMESNKFSKTMLVIVFQIERFHQTFHIEPFWTLKSWHFFQIYQLIKKVENNFKSFKMFKSKRLLQSFHLETISKHCPWKVFESMMVEIVACTRIYCNWWRLFFLKEEKLMVVGLSNKGENGKVNKMIVTPSIHKKNSRVPRANPWGAFTGNRFSRISSSKSGSLRSRHTFV